jgi:oxygen-independent coproporphyrinogen-3 oxidase
MGYTVQKSSILLGLGLSAISDTGYAFAQNTKSLKEYYRTIASGEPAIRKGYFLQEEDKTFRKHILDIACKGHTTLDRTWEAQLKEWTLPALQLLQNNGLVRVEGDEVSLTAEGRPFLRHVCKAFDLHLLRTERARLANNAICGRPAYASSL